MSTAIRLIQMSNFRPRPSDGDQVCTWYACHQGARNRPSSLSHRPSSYPILASTRLASNAATTEYSPTAHTDDAGHHAQGRGLAER
jgi:hypothetical protein